MAAEFFRCPCGKLHAQCGIWWSGTVCPGCGRKLTPWGAVGDPQPELTDPRKDQP